MPNPAPTPHRTSQNVCPDARGSVVKSGGQAHRVTPLSLTRTPPHHHPIRSTSISRPRRACSLLFWNILDPAGPLAYYPTNHHHHLRRYEFDPCWVHRGLSMCATAVASPPFAPSSGTARATRSAPWQWRRTMDRGGPRSPAPGSASCRRARPPPGRRSPSRSGRVSRPRHTSGARWCTARSLSSRSSSCRSPRSARIYSWVRCCLFLPSFFLGSHGDFEFGRA